LDDCDSRLRVTANHDATGSYNGCLPRSAHAPFITVLREPRLRCDHRQRYPCVNRGLNTMSYRFYKTDNEGEVVVSAIASGFVHHLSPCNGKINFSSV
jgi:hypothetical protein